MADPKLTEQSPLTLYNVQTNRPEKLTSGQAEQAILAGTHSVPRGTTINVVDQDGSAAGIDSGDLFNALSSGYRLETPFEKVVNDYGEENSGFTGAAKAAALGAINELGFGIPGVIADEVQDPLEVAKRKKLFDEQAAANVIGSVAGGIGSLAYGGPLFKGATKAGQIVAKGAESALARGLEKAGVQSAKAIAQGLAPKIATQAAALATEGAIVAAPRALTEAAFGDTDAAAEALLYGAGIGGILGGSIAASSPILKGMAGVYKSAKGLGSAQLGLGREANEEIIRNSAKPRVEAKAFDEAQDIAQRSIGLRAKNYDQIVNDGKLLGIDDLTEDVLTDAPLIKNMVGAISENNSVPGMAYKDRMVKQAAKLQENVEQAIGSIQKESAEKTAEMIRTQVDDLLRSKLDVADDLYRQRRQEFSAIELADDEALSVFDGAQKIVQNRLKKGNLSSRYAQEIEDALLPLTDFIGERTSLETLLNQQSNINAELRRFGQMEGVVAKQVRDGLDELKSYFDNQVESLLKKRSELLPESAGASGEAQSVMSIAKSANAAYADAKALQSKLAGLFGYNPKAKQLPRVFLQNLAFKSDQAFANRLANLGSKELKTLSELSPELFELAKQAQKTKLVRQTGKSEFGLSSTLAAYKNLDPDVKSLIFSPEEMAKMDASTRLWPRMEVNFNKSNTATTLMFNRNLLSRLNDLVENAFLDPIQVAAIQKVMNTSAVPETQRLMKAAFKVIDKTDKAVESILTKSTPTLNRARTRLGSVLERVVNDSEPRANKSDSSSNNPQDLLRKFADKASDLIVNIDSGTNRLDDLFGGFGEFGAPETATKAQAKATNAMLYLYNNLPDLVQPVNSFDLKETPRVSESEIGKFERRLEVFENPEIVAERLADGTLTREHVDTMKAIYPTMYGLLTAQATDTLLKTGMKKADYSDRMKLALLLSLDTHASLSADSIIKLQALPMKMAQESQDQSGPVPSAKAATTLAERTMTQDQRMQNS